jgi:DNA-binding transcriptional MocR family regulator
MNDVEIEHLCLKAGLQVFSSKRFATGIIDNHNGIRISISSPKNKEELIRGLEILRDVLKSYSFQFNPIL